MIDPKLIHLDSHAPYVAPKCDICGDKGCVTETVCNYCEANQPHSHCDDTYEKKVPCECKQKLK